jgi:hypothetical protein
MSEAPKEIWCSMGLYYDYKKELEAENKRLRLEAAHANDTADAAIERMKELEAKLAKAVEVKKAQQLMNYYAVEVVVYGATVSRLRNLEDAWTNLRTQATLAELKGENDE